MDLIIFGGGFNYENEEEERNAVSHNRHISTTEDLKVIAQNTSPTAFPVRNWKDFLKILTSTPGKWSHLRILSHCNGKAVAFSAKNTRSGFQWQEEVDQLTEDNLRTHQQEIRKAIAGKFTEDADIILYGCHTGGNYKSTEESFLTETIARIFEIPTRSFTKPLVHCFRYDPKTKRITDRGWIKVYERPSDFSLREPCQKKGFVRSLDQLKPDFARNPETPH